MKVKLNYLLAFSKKINLMVLVNSSLILGVGALLVLVLQKANTFYNMTKIVTENIIVEKNNVSNFDDQLDQLVQNKIIELMSEYPSILINNQGITVTTEDSAVKIQYAIDLEAKYLSFIELCERLKDANLINHLDSFILKKKSDDPNNRLDIFLKFHI